MHAHPPARLRTRRGPALTLLVCALSLPVMAQGQAPSPEEPPAVLAVPARPALTFRDGRREPEPLGYFSIKDPCARENLNRNDEPLSQRIDCQGLGVPSGWFHPSNPDVRPSR